MKIIKNFIFLTVTLAVMTVLGITVSAEETLQQFEQDDNTLIDIQDPEGTEPDNFLPIYKADPENLVVESYTDSSYVNKEIDSPDYANACGCYGGTYSNPVKVPTNVIDVKGIPLEYAIIRGNFTIFKRNGYHYYTQNATQGWFNAAAGTYAKTVYNGLGTFLLYKGVNKIPYVSKLFNTSSGKTIYNYEFLKLASSTMIQHNAPVWGKIASATVPSTGTKEVIVYISKTGADYSWHNRARFVIKPDKSVTYSTWYVN